MRKVLVVDDEKLIRTGVKTMIERKAKDFYDVVLCSNGLEALDIVSKEKIDIVITDIRMPEMDGITFIKKLQEFKFKPLILILSGYDDFNYAVEALKCGVQNYLLKPIKREELYESLDKIENIIKKSEETEAVKNAYSVHIDEYIEAEIKNIILRTDISEAEIENIGKRLQFDLLNHKYYIGLLIKEENNKLETDVSLKQDISNEINIILDRYGKESQHSGFKTFQWHNGLVIISQDISVFEIIKQKCLNDYRFRYHIGLSNPGQGIMSLKPCFAQAEEALKYRIFINYHGNTVIKYSDIQDRNKDYNLQSDKIEKLGNMLGTDRDKEIYSLFDEIFNENKFRNFSICYLEETNKLINHMVLDEIEARIFSNEEDMLKKIQKFKSIYNFKNYKQYYHELKDFIISINEYIKTMKEIYGNKDKIDKAIEFINNNYHKDINLATVSNEVSLNYSYFSQVFKEHTGENFVSYLKRVRINKAKEILKSDESKVYEVGKMVGYDDSKQFSKHFRSITGVSPIEYKRNFFKESKASKQNDGTNKEE
ncbi:response regulator transcription factor [Clostridium thermarum]|uniref:response regulator transcription factor n=1 Tax=Clostridium thermarum TaxID=1716543 RepID=UPI00111CD29D|nr:response regulator [Clostridium thermarum]